DACGAKQDAGVATLQFKRDVLRTGLPSKPMETFSKRMAGASGWTWAGEMSGAISVMVTRYRPKMPIMKRLMTKSTKMMRTEETTTAWVVDLPTPCVPPRVFMP